MLRLTKEQIQDKINYIEHYKNSNNAADASKFDSNANVTTKNIATLEAEIFKDLTIQVNMQLLYNKISEIYDEDLAKEFVRQIESHELYLHDASSLKPYCTSITMYPFLLEGLVWLGGESKAPTHINSFCGSFVNLVFAISSQFAGAVATVEFLMYFDYFARKDYWDNYLITHKRETENHLQHVVFRINQPRSSRGYQSSFWNLSLYDEYYFNSMFWNFVFPDGEKPNWDTLKRLQEFFMSWFNKERTKAVLTFPVVTAAMLSENGKPKDKEFAKMLSMELAQWNSFFIYMSDNRDALSSCCFEWNEKIEVFNKNNEKKYYTMREFVELFVTWKDGEEKIGKWYKILSYNKDWISELADITGVLKKENTQRKLLTINIGGNEIKVTLDHPLMVKDKETWEVKDILATALIWNENKYLIPLSTENIVWTEVSSLTLEENSNPVYDIELDKNHYFSANNIVTHNCRLKNKIEDNTFSYSLGAGGVSTWSINVITMNLNRIVQMGYDLKEQVEKIHKYQIAYRKIMEEMESSGLLTVYSAGFISMKKQYLTLWINGLTESAEALGYTVWNNKEYKKYVQDTLKIIYDANKKAKEETGYMFNTEMVPAENLWVKNAKWDKKDGLKVSRDVYNSYFYIVEDENINVLDKFILHWKEIMEYLDGWSALHLNLENYLSPEGYLSLIELAAKTWCNYFCTNTRITVCRECENIDKRTLQICSKCWSWNVDWATRIIWYLKCIKSFSSARQKEEGLRFYHQKQDEISIKLNNLNDDLITFYTPVENRFPQIEQELKLPSLIEESIEISE